MGTCAQKAASLDGDFESAKSEASASAGKATPLIIISDPGQDLDDEMTFIMLRHLHELQLAEVRGIVTTLSPSFDRARLTRGTLDILGMHFVPIGVGTDGGDNHGKHQKATFEEWARPYMPPRYSAASDAFCPGDMLLHNLYVDASKKSVTLLIIASMKDAALFVRDEKELFQEKTREVIIMGGVEAWTESNNGEAVVLVPDTANNNTFDMESARYLYKRIQELGIPLVIVSRWAAYAARVPVSCYNELARTGSWIGCRLRNAQRYSIESLWTRAASPPGSERRADLPDRCDRSWFLKTFCKGSDETAAAARGADDTIWDLVSGFVQYDTVATLAAIPSLREELFTPIKVMGLKGVQHQVIGRLESEPNIVSPERISRFLNTGFAKGLAYNHHRKKEIILLLQPRWSNHADNLTAFAVLRSLISLGVLDCAGVILRPAVIPEMCHTPSATASVAMFGADNIDTLGDEVQDMLRSMGLSHVPVLHESKAKTVDDHLTYLYDRVTPAGVTLVVTGCLDSAAEFAENHTKAFITKTQNIIVVGGAISVPEKDSNGNLTGGPNVLEPDPGAHQYRFDMRSAKKFFRLAQNMLVPMVAVSRHFVEAVKIPRVFFDLLREERYGSAVGLELYEKQLTGVSDLWEACQAPVKDTVRRRNLPERCSREWFIDSFCSGSSPKSKEAVDVWKSMKELNTYNAQAIMLALPPIFNRFVDGTIVTVRGVKHVMIGNSDSNPGIVDSNELRKLIMQCIVSGVRSNVACYNLEELPPIDVSDGTRRTSWRYEHKKEALNWLLPLENMPAETRQKLMSDAKPSEDLWIPRIHKG